MKPIYIHSATAITTQNTFESEPLMDIISQPNDNKWKANHPSYKAFISPVASRRMSSSVKMGVACAKKALMNAQVSTADAIIIGTGKGCIENSEKFLNALIDNEEQYLTPTSFILSTHNTVAAQIALNLKCRGYNNTLTNLSGSFESSLIDAQLLINENEKINVLVGGVEELGSEFIDLEAIVEQNENQSINVPYGEGASVFLLSEKVNSDGIKLSDVQTFSKIENIEIQLVKFLKQNNLDIADIDALILGNNGDKYDFYYDKVSELISQKIPNIFYKTLFGEFLSVSAVGSWLGYYILKKQKIPDVFKHKNVEARAMKKVLIYNQFKGRDHSFVLLSR